MEEWFKIPYLPRYEISSLRRVRIIKTGRIKKPQGYPDTAKGIKLTDDIGSHYYNLRDLLNDALWEADNELD